MSISLKKVLSIMTCLLCVVLSAIAGPIHVSASMNYSSTYKGSSRGSYGYSTSPIRTHMSSAGLAQTPTMTMTSTNSSFNRGISYGNELMTSAPQVRGIYTSASNVTGGVTTTESSGPSYGPRREHFHLPGVCEHCDWVWDPVADDYVCVVCGCHMDTGCTCDPCTCDVPLDFNGAVALFMAFLACAYAIYKVRARKSSEE